MVVTSCVLSCNYLRPNRAFLQGQIDRSWCYRNLLANPLARFRFFPYGLDCAGYRITVKFVSEIVSVAADASPAWNEIVKFWPAGAAALPEEAVKLRLFPSFPHPSSGRPPRFRS